MAGNLMASGRTNTFAVKDVPLLEALINRWCDVEVGEDGRVAISSDDGSWEIEGEYLPDVIAEHLCVGELAVFVSAGREEKNYFDGYALIVHPCGEQDRWGLDEFVAHGARKFGVDAETILDTLTW